MLVIKIYNSNKIHKMVDINGLKMPHKYKKKAIVAILIFDKLEFKTKIH